MLRSYIKDLTKLGAFQEHGDGSCDVSFTEGLRGSGAIKKLWNLTPLAAESLVPRNLIIFSWFKLAMG